MFENILVAVSEPRHSKPAMSWVRMLEPRSCTLVHVVGPVYALDPLFALPYIEWQEAAERGLNQLAASSWPGAQGLVRWGPASSAIRAAALETNADLIVLTARDGSEWMRRLFGGTLDTLSHRSTVPLLLVSPRPEPSPPVSLRRIVALDSEPVAPWADRLATFFSADVIVAPALEELSRRAGDLIVASAPRSWRPFRASPARRLVEASSPVPVVWIPPRCHAPDLAYAEKEPLCR